MSRHIDVMHAARLAQLEGAACALLREFSGGVDPDELPDGIVVRLGPDSLDIEYTRGGRPVAGEGL